MVEVGSQGYSASTSSSFQVASLSLAALALICTKGENFLLLTLISLAPVAQSGNSKVSSSVDE